MPVEKLFLALAISVLLMGHAPNAALARAPQQDFSAIDSTVNRLLDMYNVPGAAIGIVQNGKVIYTKGYGYADLDKKQLVDEQTVFSIGSISKSFTVLDLAQLADAGKIDLDAPVIKYLPDFKLSDPAATRTLTMRQVLSHSSGLPRADDRLALNLNSRQQIVADMVNIPMTAKPGEKWQYCNQNFVLAGYLVEQISGQTWEQYTQQYIFDPLGMKSASFGVDAIQNVTDHAQPYLPDTLEGAVPMPYTDLQKKVIELIGPAGSINANVVDMAQYAMFQLGDGSFNGKQIVSKAAFDQMHTQQISVAGMPEGNALIQLSLTQNIGYGLGWITESYRNHKLVHHDGQVAGYTAELTLAPDDKLGIVILSNLNTTLLFTEALRMSLLETLLNLKPQQDVVSALNHNFQYDPVQFKQNVAAARTYKADPAALDKVAGTYTGPAGIITVTKVNGILHLTLGSQNIELIPYALDSFLANGALGITISFKADSSGVLSVYQGDVAIGKRTSNAAPTTYMEPKGRFTVSISPGLTIQQIGDLGVIQTTNPAGIFVVAAADATGTDLQAEVTAWLVKYAQIKADAQPSNVRQIPINGATWTQYLYSLPDGQLLAVVALLQGKTVYFVSLTAKPDAIAALTPNFNALLLSFKITA
ncbi:MAG: serine hydrolase domain-containing protein [Aggregatilineales bacterium]